MNEVSPEKEESTTMRFRNVFLGFGSFVIALILLLTDPDSGVLLGFLPVGSSTITTFITLMSSILFVLVLHWSRKALFDYIDLEIVIKKAVESPQGAGLVVVGIGLFVVAVSIVILAAR